MEEVEMEEKMMKLRMTMRQKDTRTMRKSKTRMMAMLYKKMR